LDFINHRPEVAPEVVRAVIMIYPKCGQAEFFKNLFAKLKGTESALPGLMRVASQWKCLNLPLEAIKKCLPGIAANGLAGDADEKKAALALIMLQSLIDVDKPETTKIIYPVVEKCLTSLIQRLPGIAAKIPGEFLAKFFGTLVTCLHAANEQTFWVKIHSAFEKIEPVPKKGMSVLAEVFLPEAVLANFCHKDGGLGSRLGEMVALFWRWQVPGTEEHTWTRVLRYYEALLKTQQPEAIVLEAVCSSVPFVSAEQPTESAVKEIAPKLIKFFAFSPAFRLFLETPEEGHCDNLRAWLHAVVVSRKRRKETARPAGMETTSSSKLIVDFP
jgi:hypothetical protein